jgi:hypothetical protein
MAVGTPLLARQRRFVAKLESAYGTYETLAAADGGWRATGVSLQIIADTIKREREQGHGLGTGVQAGASTSLDFSMMLTGSATAPVWAAVFLPSCCMKLTTRTYAMVETPADWKTISAAHYRAGRIVRARGLMGTWSLKLVAGQPAVMTFKYLGGQVPVATKPTEDVALLTGVTDDIVIPPIWNGATALSLAGGTDFPCSEITIEQGGEVVLREDANATGGYLSGWVANHLPTVTIEPEATAYSVKDWGDIQLDGAKTVLAAKVGLTANNIITIGSSSLGVSKFPTDGERGGRLTDQLVFDILDNDLTILFS